jgi:hypothetical protein
MFALAPNLAPYNKVFSMLSRSLKEFFPAVINLYEKTLLGALSDTPKLADNITFY